MKRFHPIKLHGLKALSILVLLTALMAMPSVGYAGGDGDKLDAIHHVVDAHYLDFEPFGKVKLPHIEIAGFDISPTRHVVMLWIAAIILLVVFSMVSSHYKKLNKHQAPKGLANLMEVLVDFVKEDVAKQNIGHGYERHMPYLLTIFFFILICNLIGLVPFSATATGNINVTATLAIFTFFITQISSIRAHGIGGYLAHLTGGTHPLMWIIMVPVEFIGLFTKPFALTVRLFANMTAGHIVIISLLGLIFVFKSYFIAPVSVAFALFIYLLEILVSFLQAYIFTLLSALFIGMAQAHDGHEEASAH
jgi:F-type H+-transporting ATPase subunit a